MHRKHPAPEQFREEYGREWTGAVYCLVDDFWHTAYAEDVKHGTISLFDGRGMTEIEWEQVICACTPYGKPDDDFEVTE